MLGGAELLAAVSGAALTPLTGVLHRYVRNSFIALARSKGTALHILSGEWARKTGGRLNFPNRYRTAYMALDPVTARVEAERIVAPYVHVPIVANLQHVLRVDDPAITRLLELSPSELRVEWRTANARGIEVHTQRLGNVSYAARRIEAIAYPSTVNPGGVCVGVFPERLSPGSFLEIQDPDGVIQERIAG
jgi:RES domain-containing protein